MAKELDSTDWKILRVVSQNARLPVSKIARKTALSRDVVEYRLQQMVKNGVISKFITFLNFSKAGFGVWTYIHLSFKDLTAKREKELIEYTKAHSNVIFAASNLGTWDFRIEFWALDNNHFYQLQRELKEKFSDIIKDSETGSFLEVHKMDFVPIYD